METHFEHELGRLTEALLAMAGHAETAVTAAVQALVNRDADLALRVRQDDEILDRFEVEIDEKAIAALAKAQLASDLRLVTVAMKIGQNLERVGDEATKIAKRARDLSAEPPLKLTLDFPRLAQLALGLLKEALDAFVNRDPAVARALIPRDRAVDDLNRVFQAQLAQFMTQAPDTVGRCLHLITAAKSLERIADHAKNIAEEVVYLCEAEDIRHRASQPPAAAQPTSP